MIRNYMMIRRIKAITCCTLTLMCSPYFTDQSSAQSTQTYVCETIPLVKIVPQRDGRYQVVSAGSQKSRLDYAYNSARGNNRLASPWNNPANPPEKNPLLLTPSDFSELILKKAKVYRGCPYRWGGSLNAGWGSDCSAFVQYIYREFNIDLPRCSIDQAQVGKKVTQTLDVTKLLPGDLLFFRRSRGTIGHIGIYMGDGKMIHSSSSCEGVGITDLNDPYHINTFVVAKRVFEVQYP